MKTVEDSDKVVQVSKAEIDPAKIKYRSYAGDHDLPLIMNLVDQELSEPYSIFTYRYFVYLCPQLCFLAFDDLECVGTVVCKMGDHRGTMRGYIAMLVVLDAYRGKGIATELVTRSIIAMMESGCEEVALEAEVTNKGALALYGRLGFIRAKRLYRYYLNGVDAFRLKLLFPPKNMDKSSDISAASLSSASGIGEASPTAECGDVSISCPSYSSVDQIPASGTSNDSVQLPAFSTSDASAQLPTYGTSDDVAVQISSSGTSDAAALHPTCGTYNDTAAQISASSTSEDAAVQLLTSGTSDDVAVQNSSSGTSDAAAQRPTCGTSDDTAAKIPTSGGSEDAAVQLSASCASDVAAVKNPASGTSDDTVQIPRPVTDDASRVSGL